MKLSARVRNPNDEPTLDLREVIAALADGEPITPEDRLVPDDNRPVDFDPYHEYR